MGGRPFISAQGLGKAQLMPYLHHHHLKSASSFQMHVRWCEGSDVLNPNPNPNPNPSPDPTRSSRHRPGDTQPSSPNPNPKPNLNPKPKPKPNLNPNPNPNLARTLTLGAIEDLGMLPEDC